MYYLTWNSFIGVPELLSPGSSWAVSEKWADLAKSHAQKFAVSPSLHKDDHIFNFLASNRSFHSDESRVQYYFNDGAKSADRFLDLVGKHVGNIPKPDVLEFASGYGCVTRHLSRSSRISLYSSDIHEAAIEFLAKEIGVRTIQSSAIPESLLLPIQFDVVFALSFFSHMPITTWARWLVRLCQAAKSGGIIAFTTQGNASRRFFGNPELPEMGFWFANTSEQKDLSADEYGQSIVTPSFVYRHLSTIPSVELIETREAYWWDHQDLFVVRKTGCRTS